MKNGRTKTTLDIGEETDEDWPIDVRSKGCAICLLVGID